MVLFGEIVRKSRSGAAKGIHVSALSVSDDDGIVYQKDLGPDSLNIVKNKELDNPDPSWGRTNDEWPLDVATAVPWLIHVCDALEA